MNGPLICNEADVQMALFAGEPFMSKPVSDQRHFLIRIHGKCTAATGVIIIRPIISDTCVDTDKIVLRVIVTTAARREEEFFDSVR